MSNLEAQDDELLALSSIYEDSYTSRSGDITTEELDGETQLRGGELAVQLDLPNDFNLCVNNETSEVVNHLVQYLPPIYLHFRYPLEYPSHNPPEYTLSCKWLNIYQLTKVCRHLDSLWLDNEGSVIMFTWAQFLKEESLKLLHIGAYLDLARARPARKHRLSSASSVDNSKHSPTNCAESPSVSCVEEDNNGDISGKSEGKLSRQTSSRNTFDDRAIQDIAPNTNILRLLKDYDEEMRLKAFTISTFECKVCFSEKSGANCLEFWPCRHVYCKECMKSYFEVQIKEGNIKFLRCPDEKCESEANPKQVQDLVPEDLYKRWDEMLLNSTLSSLGDIQPCPRVHCQYPVTIEDGQGSCPNCKFVFCGLCRFGWHGIEPCRLQMSEAKEVLDSYKNGNTERRLQLEIRYGKKYLLKLEEEFLSSDYLNEHSKQCPRCRTKIEKIDGCNKMTCQRCSNYFCWLCMKMLDKATPYDHYNNSKSVCYQKLFYGTVIDEDAFFDEDDDDGVDDDDYEDYYPEGDLRLLAWRE